MKTSIAPLRLAQLTAAFVILHSSFVIAQGGSLTPPGAPAPTMKTLDQLEARTPISSAPFTISTPGSYYLTGNLAVTTGSAITISADQVTLDLNGFAISSTHATGNGTGVLINGARTNVTVKNGHIRGTTTFAANAFTIGGFLDGASGNNTGCLNVRVSDVSVHGMGAEGIDLFSNTTPSLVVERCAVSVCGRGGIRAGLARDCVVETVGSPGTAISADIVINCSGETVSTQIGDAGIQGITLVENCRGISVAGSGVSGDQVSNSAGRSISGIGLDAFTALNSAGTSTSGIGLEANNATNCEGTSTSGSFGLRAVGTASFCRGKRDGGVAISAPIAIGCTVNGTGTVTSAQKHLGTP